MIKDPLGTLHSVYERFDLPFTDEAEKRAQRWIDGPTQHMSAVKFTLEDFDLDEQTVEAGFGAYRERFAAYF